MKVHYINILLFALPLNILEHNKNEPHTTPNHTQTTRSLCECKLYSPTNYDSDPEMKRVMQQFVDRTTQRFHEYDERMQSKRMQCKEQCDKEIQNIILKDKLEKELMDKFATLQTDIQSDAIPTCDKSTFKIEELSIGSLDSIINTNTYTDVTLISGFIQTEYSRLGCGDILTRPNKPICTFVNERIGATSRGTGVSPKNFIETTVETMVSEAESVAAAKAAEVAAAKTPEFTTRNIAAVEAATTPYYTPIIASIIAIEVIVLIMVIIYLILRYRRKKKMKKKLQYIKLLKE
ncbi:hypothetical protein PFDG_03709 [Plasmodium falciparum Dd2]|uniref:Rifin n=1 Tax=Plasmodium falciparum (isolate Dd2) TaxID=57267 RepID=A0A0L7M3W5_PLAF4|nr:hypothetical protein PFDG_03709 [Plasmodium falciparum Dd2]